MFRSARLVPALLFAGVLFVLDALLVNVVLGSLFVAVLQVAGGLLLGILKQAKPRHILAHSAIFVGNLVLVYVMVQVNASVAPARAERVIAAIETYRAATGVYPKTLEDLMPNYLDHVPWAQYTLGGQFYYLRGGTTEPPLFWYNPHAMDHRGYQFDTRKWFYLG